MAPLQLLEQLEHVEKTITTTINNLISSLQSLEKRHKELVRRKVESSLLHSGIRRKLQQREQLELKEATGDCFSKLYSEISQPAKLSTPYTKSS